MGAEIKELESLTISPRKKMVGTYDCGTVGVKFINASEEFIQILSENTRNKVEISFRLSIDNVYHYVTGVGTIKTKGKYSSAISDDFDYIFEIHSEIYFDKLRCK